MSAQWLSQHDERGNDNGILRKLLISIQDSPSGLGLWTASSYSSLWEGSPWRLQTLQKS